MPEAEDQSIYTGQETNEIENSTIQRFYHNTKGKPQPDFFDIVGKKTNQ